MLITLVKWDEEVSQLEDIADFFAPSVDLLVVTCPAATGMFDEMTIE